MGKPDQIIDVIHKSLLTAVQDICLGSLNFTTFVKVTGLLCFNVDEKQVLNVSLNQLVEPVTQSLPPIQLEETVKSTDNAEQIDQSQVGIETICTTEEGPECFEQSETFLEDLPVVSEEDVREESVTEDTNQQELSLPPEQQVLTTADNSSHGNDEDTELTTDEDPNDNLVQPKTRSGATTKKSPPRSASKRGRKKSNICICGHECRNARDLKKHQAQCDRMPTSTQQNTTKSSSGKFQCKDCDFRTDHSGHYREHLNRHLGVKPHKCEHCDRSFIRQDDYRRHLELHNRKFECMICHKDFPSRDSLKGHAKSEHGKTGRLNFFKCKFCKKNQVNQSELDKHVTQKHKHSCSMCSEVFAWRAELRKHTEESHQNEKYVCTVCGRECPSKSALNKHALRHSANNFPCDICDRVFTAQSTLYHHKRGIHNNLKPYKCTQCDATFSFHHSLKLHLLKHDGARPYKCSECDKTYLTNTHLKSHFKAVHRMVKEYRCLVCNKEFSYENSLKMHVMLHTGNKPFMCAVCGKSFISNGALKAHMSTHEHTGKTHQCLQCNKKYKTDALLKVHMRRHSSLSSRFMCEVCGNTFMYKSNLEMHYKVHGEQREFTCQTCNKSFKTYATLYSHKLVHQPDAPFVCKECGKGFKSKDRVLIHEKRHLGLKPFSCDLCGRCFPDKGGLTKHQKTVHYKPKRFACPACGKTTARADNLRVHMKVHGDPSLLALPYTALMVQDKSEPAGRTENEIVTLEKEPAANYTGSTTQTQNEDGHTNRNQFRNEPSQFIQQPIDETGGPVHVAMVQSELIPPPVSMQIPTVETNRNMKWVGLIDSDPSAESALHILAPVTHPDDPHRQLTHEGELRLPAMQPHMSLNPMDMQSSQFLPTGVSPHLWPLHMQMYAASTMPGTKTDVYHSHHNEHI